MVYCYGEWQHTFPDSEKVCTDIEFMKSIGLVLQNGNFLTADKPNVKVIDHFAVALPNDVRATKWFTQRIRHRNPSLKFILQNPYKRGMLCGT